MPVEKLPRRKSKKILELPCLFHLVIYKFHKIISLLVMFGCLFGRWMSEIFCTEKYNVFRPNTPCANVLVVL